MRGEYGEIEPETLADTGSPPHAWRIPLRMSSTVFAVGITSTCVENT